MGELSFLAGPTSRSRTETSGYKGYVLTILTFVYTLNFLDRMLVILLLQPIKNDLHLSDTQLGFLTGIAFGLFYATLGIPIARWADRGDRVTITSIAIGLWGVTVMACVGVTNFTQLLLARVAAAVGEAGCMPPTYSLLGDYFPTPAGRTRAMAIYWLANPLSSLIGFVVGARLNEVYGWRVTFFIVGVPALIVAAVVRVTVRDPRAAMRFKPISKKPAPSMAYVFCRLWRQPSSRHLAAGLVLLFTMSLGLAPWYAAFLMRSHGMSSQEVGLSLGLGFGIVGVLGTWLGGYISSRWLAGNERVQMYLSATMIVALLPCFALFLLLDSRRLALLALIPLITVFNFYLGPSFALLQRLVDDHIRASTLAVVMLLANLVGMGIGPQVVGLLSDMLSPRFGSDGLRYAMLIMSVVAVWSAYHFWKVGQYVERDLEDLKASRRGSRGSATPEGFRTGGVTDVTGPHFQRWRERG
jgi:predicted MFS family arabinose efflux permease